MSKIPKSNNIQYTNIPLQYQQQQQQQQHQPYQQQYKPFEPYQNNNEYLQKSYQNNRIKEHDSPTFANKLEIDTTLPMAKFINNHDILMPNIHESYEYQQMYSPKQINQFKYNTQMKYQVSPEEIIPESNEANLSLSNEPNMKMYLNPKKNPEHDKVQDHLGNSPSIGYSSTASESNKMLDSPFSSKNSRPEQNTQEGGNRILSSNSIIEGNYSDQNSKKRAAKPIVIMNINIGPNRSSDLHIYEGEDPHFVAEQFCKVNNLPSKFVDIVGRNLEDQVMIYYKKKEENMRHLLLAQNQFQNESGSYRSNSSKNQIPNNNNSGLQPTIMTESSDENYNYTQRSNKISNPSSASPYSANYYSQPGTLNTPKSSHQVSQNNYEPPKMSSRTQHETKRLNEINPEKNMNQLYHPQTTSTPKQNSKGANFFPSYETPKGVTIPEQGQNPFPNYNAAQPKLNKNYTNPQKEFIIFNPNIKTRNSRSKSPVLKSPHHSNKRENSNRSKDKYQSMKEDKDNDLQTEETYQKCYSAKSLKNADHQCYEEDEQNEFADAQEEAFNRLYKRGMIQKKKKDMMIAEFKRQKEIEPIEEAVFHPKINENTSEILKKRTASPINNVYQTRIKMEKRQKAAEIKSKMEMAKCTFQPEIDPASRKIAQSKFERDRSASKKRNDTQQKDNHKTQNLKKPGRNESSSKPGLMMNKANKPESSRNQSDYHDKSIRSIRLSSKDRDHNNSVNASKNLSVSDLYKDVIMQKNQSPIRDKKNNITKKDKDISIQSVDPDIVPLKHIFEILDADGDGLISYETVNYSSLNDKIITILAPILMKLEEYDSLDFEHFCGLITAENLLPKIKDVIKIDRVKYQASDNPELYQNTRIHGHKHQEHQYMKNRNADHNFRDSVQTFCEPMSSKSMRKKDF